MTTRVENRREARFQLKLIAFPLLLPISTFDLFSVLNNIGYVATARSSKEVLSRPDSLAANTRAPRAFPGRAIG